MIMSIFSILKRGHFYSKQWPVKPELNSLFPENKVILLTNFSRRYLPILAVATAYIQYNLLGSDFLPQILAMMLLIASVPLQGLYWLGVRSKTKLVSSHSAWLKQICHAMSQHGLDLPTFKQPGKYSDLAKVLQQAYAQLDKAFIREWI
ncbi:terminus macrodomain insulation protein YfbV [Rheinheimera sp. WS51]|uniref:terminus macrodomain insulation protein YfbV n=1 Tax=Rheinheimera sp. WS51 TaxID=3425886 RepID=UPI003D916FC8